MNDQGIIFGIKGTPEVAVKVVMDLKDIADTGTTPEDIYLAAGTYRDWTQTAQNADYTGDFTLAASSGVNTSSTDVKYYPIIFTLEETYSNGAYSIGAAATALTATGMSNRWGVDTSTSGKTVITGTLADIDRLFTKLTALMEDCGVNYVFDNTFKLTWKWEYEQSTYNSNCDKADTLLGNLQAGTVALASGDVTVANASKGSTGSFGVMTDPGDYHLRTGFNFTISVTQVD